jgi:hypothetical protein
VGSRILSQRRYGAFQASNASPGDANVLSEARQRTNQPLGDADRAVTAR